MNRKEIRNLANQKIKDGKTHQETFEEIKNETDLKEIEVAKIISAIPSPESKRKYKIPQILLIIILSITVLFKLIFSLSVISESSSDSSLIILISPIINIVLLIGIAMYKTNLYKIVSLLTLLSVTRSISTYIDNGLNSLTIIDLSISAALIILGLYLNSKMVAKSRYVKEAYINANGQKRLKKVLKFVN